MQKSTKGEKIALIFLEQVSPKICDYLDAGLPNDFCPVRFIG